MISSMRLAGYFLRAWAVLLVRMLVSNSRNCSHQYLQSELLILRQQVARLLCFAKFTKPQTSSLNRRTVQVASLSTSKLQSLLCRPKGLSRACCKQCISSLSIPTSSRSTQLSLSLSLKLQPGWRAQVRLGKRKCCRLRGPCCLHQLFFFILASKLFKLIANLSSIDRQIAKYEFLIIDQEQLQIILLQLPFLQRISCELEAVSHRWRSQCAQQLCGPTVGDSAL